MKCIFINEELQGRELNELLLFVGKISDKMSFARYYNGKLNQDEFNKMQLEYKSVILEKNKEKRIIYKKNINGYKDRIDALCGAKMSVEEYFNHQLEQEIQMCNSLDYENFKNGQYEHYQGSCTDFLYLKYTRNTPVTSGPVFEMCFFMIGDTYNNLLSNMKKLFEYPYKIEGSEFEDLTFYKGERSVLAICSHEHFALMDLEENEYKEFEKLRIPFELN